MKRTRFIPVQVKTVPDDRPEGLPALRRRNPHQAPDAPTSQSKTSSQRPPRSTDASARVAKGHSGAIRK